MPNDRLLEVLERGVSMVDAFRMADDVLRQGVQGICDLITRPGVINLDFADVRTVMAESGSALMGIGMATGAGARPRGRAARARLAADRPAHPWRDRRAALDHGAAGADAAGGHGGGRGRARGRRRPAPTSSSARRSTTTLGDQLWVTVIATGFERQGSAGAGEPERSRDRSPLRELEVDDDLDVPSFLRD